MRCIFTNRTTGMTSFSIGTNRTIGPSVWRIVSVCVYWTCVEAICWKSNSLVLSWSVGFNPLQALQEWATCCVLGHLTLTMPHSSNNITFRGSGGTHTCKNKTLVFNCEDHFHFHRFCLSYFFKRFFLVRHRRNLAILLKIRATFRPDSAEVTANSNTLDVFQYKT